MRIQNQVLFSATYLSELFKSATESLYVSPLTKFDFIAATRQQNQLDRLFSSHLTEFLVLASKSRIPYEGILSYIVSALLMDVYPPRMHCWFNLFFDKK